jgi:molybdopterin molybdotransferase
MQSSTPPFAVSLETALEIVLSEISPLQETETRHLLDSIGRICAVDLYTSLDVPSFDRSPLDGFAFNSSDTVAACSERPAKLTVKGVVYAGDAPDFSVGSGEAVKIMTGAMMPEGCDCVAAKESVTEKAGCVYIPVPYTHHQNYVFRGHDVQKGTLLIPRGTKIDHICAGILASAGIGSVPVFRKANIALMCSGDELIAPGEPLTPGKIFDSNYALFFGRLTELGFSVNCLPARSTELSHAQDSYLMVQDNPHTAAEAIDSRIDSVDFFITTGAVSVGDKDIFHDVFKILNVKKLFWRMDFKPGMSTLCGVYKGKLLLCLSGNPFAAYTVFEVLAKPALERLAGRTTYTSTRKQTVLNTPFEKSSGVRRFVRGYVDEQGVSLPKGQANGKLFSLLGCNCLVDIPAGSPPLNVGDKVDIVLL